MLKVNLAGYVSSVRSNTTSTGKKVTNIKVGVPISKINDKQTYQNFDIAFWDNNADSASQIQEKDYVFIPEVVITKFETSEGKNNNQTYINISGIGNIIFKSLPLLKNDSSSESNTPEILL